MDIEYFQDILAQDVPPFQSQCQLAKSQLDYLCTLDVNSRAQTFRQTSIICTIGATGQNVKNILDMIEAGMNIARLPMARSLEFYAETIAIIRLAVAQYNARYDAEYTLAIAIDVKGAEIRTGTLDGGPMADVELKTGETIKLTTDKYYMDRGSAKLLYIDYENLGRYIQPENRIYIDDGLITLVVTGTKGMNILCFIEHGGMLSSCKDCKITGLALDLPVVTDKDRQVIAFAVDQNIDVIFVPSVRDSYNLKDIRNMLAEKGKKIQVFSRIDNQHSIENIDAILEATDGILFERGNLCIEIPPEKVFLAQKSLIAKANRAGKPIICATHFLHSMIKNLRPTRAEVADIANTVMDGADCLMLCAETAEGNHPLECIKMMSNVCKEAEAAVWQSRMFDDLCKNVNPPIDVSHAIAICAVEAAAKCAAKAIIVITTSGVSAFFIAKYRPRCPIIAVTRKSFTARQANLHRGVIPLLYTAPTKANWTEDVNDRIDYCLKYALSNGIIMPGQPAVLITGWQQGSGFTNTMRIVFVSTQGDAIQ